MRVRQSEHVRAIVRVGESRNERVRTSEYKFEVHPVLCLPRNLHFEGHQVLRLPRSRQTSHMSQSHDSLHLSRNQSASTVTTTSKVLCLQRNLHFEVSPLRSHCTCHEKPTLDHQNTRFPLRLPRKVTTMCEHAHGATTRALQPPRFRETAQSKCTSTIERGMNVL